MELFSIDTFPYKRILRLEWIKTKKGRLYPMGLAAFDIETTRIEAIEQSVMYVWQFALQVPGFDIAVCIGRTWEEYQVFVERLTGGLEDEKRLVVFVHNLSFEFQFLRSWFDFTQPESVFLVRNRKVLIAKTGAIEYRCSYLQTNMGLDEFTHKYGVEYAKVRGFDYNKKRYSWTKLTAFEIRYITADVVGLIQAMLAQMLHDGDTLATLPFTSTGYVRRDLKKAMAGWYFHSLVDMQPDVDVFEMLREAFRGGDVHANRFYTGQILHGVKSTDRSSSYPDEQCNELFPMGKWIHEKREVNIEFVLSMIKHQGRAFVARIAVYDLELKRKDFGAPYLSRDKCRRILCRDKYRERYMYDNGRILYADYLETTVTDIDLRIIMEEYIFSGIKILDIAHCRYAKLPQPWIDCNLEYYRLKTELKGVSGMDLYYMKAKQKLNAIYGDTVQDPARPRELYGIIPPELREMYLIPEDEEREGFFTDNTPVKDLLEKAERYPYKNFAWGVWTTAHARDDLHKVIRMAHNALDPETGIRFNGFVYSDTDSVKYLGTLPELKQYNAERRELSKENGACAKDPKGKWHYMGVYEDETGPEGYEEFITLGAKKYAYRENGKLHLTLAGVGKIDGAEELEKAGGLKAFRNGFTFHEAGGLEAIYNDDNFGKYHIAVKARPRGRFHKNRLIHRVIHTVHITTNVTLRPSSYTLGLAADYARILSDPQIYLDIFGKSYYNDL